jgi:hypothetical protein
MPQANPDLGNKTTAKGGWVALNMNLTSTPPSINHLLEMHYE